MQNRRIAREWTRPSEIRARIQKLWDRGELLGCLVNDQSLFPLRLPIKAPTSTDMMERFDEVRAWIQELQTTPHARVEMRRFNHRVLGANLVPHEIWIDTAHDAIALTGNQQAATCFMRLLESTRRRQPDLVPWLAEHPLDALKLFAEWDRLLETIAWIRDHPRPGVYLRQVDAPGVNSKFLEAHRGVFSEMLDMMLPPTAVDKSASGVTEFEKRYGFLEKPARIRFRILDPKCALLAGGFPQDITLDAESFAHLSPRVSRVFITENEINFLAFPRVETGLVIFGAGYGFAALAKAKWLSGCHLHYWGDIDTHGFAILDQLRSHFGAAQSLLMDRATLLRFESQWDVEEKQIVRDLKYLDKDEQGLYNDLRDNRIRKNLRLEQERIGFAWVESTLSALA